MTSKSVEHWLEGGAVRLADGVPDVVMQCMQYRTGVLGWWTVRRQVLQEVHQDMHWHGLAGWLWESG